MRSGASRGAASVEHAGLAALIALIAIAAIAALRAAPPDSATRELGGTIARRMACAPRHPVPCGRNPLALAYGFALGKLVRSLAPAPLAVLGPGGPTPARGLPPLPAGELRGPGSAGRADCLEPARHCLHLGRGPAAAPAAQSGSPTGATARAWGGSWPRSTRDRPRSRPRRDPPEPRGRPCPGPSRDTGGAKPRAVPARRGTAVALASPERRRLSPTRAEPACRRRPQPSGSGCASRSSGRRRPARGSPESRSRPRSRSAGPPSR